MPICSYLVIPDDGATDRVLGGLAELSGCEVARAENRDVLILITDTPGLEEEHALRSRVEKVDGIRALLLTFGEIDPDARIPDPLAVSRRHRPSATSGPGAGEPGSALRNAPDAGDR